MPCCQKTRKAKVKQLIQRRLFETEGFSVLKRLTRIPPPSLQDNLLIAHHKKLHEIYEKAKKFKSVNKALVHHLVERHDAFVREMTKRGIKHKTPIQRF
jgi:hypothetical protein